MSLTSSLHIATEALFTATAEIQNTNNNIANANTPGYTREIVNLQTATVHSSLGVPQPGNGVILNGFESVRNSLLQRQMEEGTQGQAQANAQLTSLQQIQSIFNNSTQNIGTEMSALFASISALSTSPQDPVSRQGVLAAGQNLVTSFNVTSNALNQQQSGLNNQVDQDVKQINEIAKQIAALNPQIATSGPNGVGTLQDQQDQLILNLSKLTGISVTKTESGVTLTTGNGTPLVIGTKAFALQTVTGPGGMTNVVDGNGTDITSTIQGGDLGGTLQTRDSAIPALLNQLDTLANQFAGAFNSVQASGYDGNGNPGGAFFNVPSGVAGSAGAISMAISDPNLIAASSDRSLGSNGNLANFSAIQDSPLPSGQSPTDAYANLVYQIGSMTSTANSESNSASASLLQLGDQWNSVSGVSIDEESTNLIQYQQAYQAAARVISTVQALFQITMSMGTASAA
jgi:flagellar hook-associated protein 1 FlgK